MDSSRKSYSCQRCLLRKSGQSQFSSPWPRQRATSDEMDSCTLPLPAKAHRPYHETDKIWQTNNSIILTGEHDGMVEFPTIFFPNEFQPPALESLSILENKDVLQGPQAPWPLADPNWITLQPWNISHLSGHKMAPSENQICHRSCTCLLEMST